MVNRQVKRRVLRVAAPMTLIVLGVIAFLLLRPGENKSKPPTPRATTIYISPTGKGDESGSSWGNAATLRDLPAHLAKEPIGQVLLAADEGAYRVSKPVELNSGGTAQHPLVVRGASGDGRPAVAHIVGTRAAPYRPDGDPGSEAFTLRSGASNVTFSDIDFRNVGNGCFNITDDISNLTVQDVTAENVRRFIEDNPNKHSGTATISSLTVQHVRVLGFSRGVARLGSDTNQVLFEDVYADSQRQDHDPFAQGIELRDTVHAATFRNVTMLNATDTTNKYWNGDGFSTESMTRDITFDHTRAAGNTDAGYDLKSSGTVLIATVAEDNKRNYRFWGEATARDCVSDAPRIRGGTGTQDQIYATQSARVTLQSCRLTDSSPLTIVIEANDHSLVQASGLTIEHNKAGQLQQTADQASISLQNPTVHTTG
jgi:hypothetical protein